MILACFSCDFESGYNFEVGIIDLGTVNVSGIQGLGKPHVEKICFESRSV